MADDIDLGSRDPHVLNNHVKATFHEVLGEPEGAHSIDCVWSNSYKCFECGKNCCYKFITALCGIFIALYWGCEFAMISFEQIWCAGPSLRVCAIYTGLFQKVCGNFCNCCLGPICETCGLLFSRITVYNK
ncbi:hypothetical protein ScPMuIL_009161 [Solemya velum]